MDGMEIFISVEPPLLSAFYEILQAGFRVHCPVGVNIENLLTEKFELDPKIIEEKVNTIFLNGKPVDDIALALVEDDSRIALSGAMPGLVGATLRKKSPLASFRQSISYEEGSGEGVKTPGTVHIKLFNILLKDLAPTFLGRGIYIDSEELKSFFLKQSSDFWQRCLQFIVDGKPVNPERFAGEYIPQKNAVILLIVKTSGQAAASMDQS
jgi:hypothetical protein